MNAGGTQNKGFILFNLITIIQYLTLNVYRQPLPFTFNVPLATQSESTKATAAKVDPKTCVNAYGIVGANGKHMIALDVPFQGGQGQCGKQLHS